MTLSEQDHKLAEQYAQELLSASEKELPGARVRSGGDVNMAVAKTTFGLAYLEKLIKDYGFSLEDAQSASALYLHPLFPEQAPTNPLKTDVV